MDRKILNMFEENKSSNIDKILNKSSRAVCGTVEKEVVVKDIEVSKTKQILKSKGFIIIGTGPAGFKRTKVWFNPAGVNLWTKKEA